MLVLGFVCLFVFVGDGGGFMGACSELLMFFPRFWAYLYF